jgi:hypothetical protein
MKRLLLVPLLLTAASLTACYQEQPDVVALPVAVPASDPVIIVGPAGEKGDTGNTGDTGAQGDQGNTGDQGVEGQQGVEGEQGEQGVDGSDRR